MVDGFHWTRVTSKQLRFLYETVTLNPVPEEMYALAAKVDRKLVPAGSPELTAADMLAGEHAAGSAKTDN
ncbi:protein of unknown function [Hyphomicrobium sp. 1Nfss2.1]|uniref:hypothetical protein n=1 Tax=Hyphomicrobium sp. 1Nfss2.1 TaxID=3413936 RepID=UPI003C7AE0AE